MNYLGEVKKQEDPPAYVVTVGPWKREFPVENDLWINTHDKAVNWKHRKIEKFESLMRNRTSVPIKVSELQHLVEQGFGPAIAVDEMDDDCVLSGVTPRFMPGTASVFWKYTLKSLAPLADDTHKAHATNPKFAATEFGAVSGRAFETLVEMYNRTDIGNLAYMALHAPQPYSDLFRDLHGRLTHVVQKRL